MSEEKKPFGVKAEEIPMILVNKKCRSCFGRGWVGQYLDGSVKPCVCALKELRRRHALAIAAATKSPGGAKQASPEAPAPVQQEKSNGMQNQEGG